VVFDVFANRLLNYGIDTTLIVDICALNDQKCGVHKVIAEVLAINSSNFNEGTTVSVDIFGIS